MNRKQQFLKAITNLAPGDKFIRKSAERLPEESLPVAPGAVALELAVARQKPLPRSSDGFSQQQPECKEREGQLSMSHALRIQSAHYWLKLGEVDQAILELGALSTKAGDHPLAVKTRLAVLRAARKLNEVIVQEYGR